MRLAGIIADDLTGAMDTGLQLAKRGMHTVVMLGGEQLPSAEAVVINTDSRDQPAEEAYQRARQAARRLSGRALYKKIDSTLRGNIGAELDGVLDGLGWERALVAPAFPAAGRTTVDGYHYVQGVLLTETSFAHDPLWPACESHLPTLLARQTRRSVGHLPLSAVEQGVLAVVHSLMGQTASVIAADAAEPGHLRALALALAHMAEPWLPCGSAGLADGWAVALGLEDSATAPLPWPADPRPVLVVAGSRHPSTARQLQQAAQDNYLHLVHLSTRGDCETDAWSKVVSLLNQGRNVALTTTFSEHQQGKEAAIAEALARATAEVVAYVPLSGLVITGGDVARAVCQALGIAALHIVHEVQAGVPAGIVVGGPHDGLRVVTKAGGFGDDLVILHSICCIQGEWK